MAILIVLVIMAGCAALQFLKGSFIKSFAAFMAALCASIVAFGWFEQSANLMFIERDMLPDWGQLICFMLIFVITTAVLVVIISLLAKHPINLGIMPERIGRAAFGIALGFIVSGVLLTAIEMAPISNNYPYQRFDTSISNPPEPSKAIFNPDGFVTGLFGIISSGSLSGTNSFAVLHANFLNQLSFSRYQTGKSISALATRGSIRIPDKAAAWPAPQGLKNTDGESVSSNDIVIVRIGLTTAVMKTNGVFIPGQLRLICKGKDDKEPFKGSAVSIYPSGYLKTPDQLQTARLDEQIKVQSSDFKDGVKWFDFAFHIPAGNSPIAAAFKANVIVAVPPMVSAEEAPK
jgi:hypothetical protein